MSLSSKIKQASQGQLQGATKERQRLHTEEKVTPSAPVSPSQGRLRVLACAIDGSQAPREDPPGGCALQIPLSNPGALGSTAPAQRRKASAAWTSVPACACASPSLGDWLLPLVSMLQFSFHFLFPRPPS